MESQGAVELRMLIWDDFVGGTDDVVGGLKTPSHP